MTTLVSQEHQLQLRLKQFLKTFQTTGHASTVGSTILTTRVAAASAAKLLKLIPLAGEIFLQARNLCGNAVIVQAIIPRRQPNVFHAKNANMLTIRLTPGMVETVRMKTITMMPVARPVQQTLLRRQQQNLQIRFLLSSKSASAQGEPQCLKINKSQPSSCLGLPRQIHCRLPHLFHSGARVVILQTRP